MKKKILIIEDQDETREMYSLVLEREGYQVLHAADGVDGLRLATEEHPDLILLDVLMPVMDGYEVLEKIKMRKLPPRVIMVTSLCSTEDVVRFTRAGACDYITKPVSPEDFRDTVKRVLEVEATIDLNANETPPIIEQLISTAEKLERDKEKLSQENEKLLKQNLAKKHSQQLILIALRLLCLVIAVAITILLHALSIISKTQAVFLPLILFLLLLLPIERVKKLSVKVSKAETGVEMDDQ
jgi:two-component system cell cycle response regulator DivK